MAKCKPIPRLSNEEQREYQAQYYAAKLSEAQEATGTPSKCPNYGTADWWLSIQAMNRERHIVSDTTASTIGIDVSKWSEPLWVASPVAAPPEPKPMPVISHHTNPVRKGNRKSTRRALRGYPVDL